MGSHHQKEKLNKLPFEKKMENVPPIMYYLRQYYFDIIRKQFKNQHFFVIDNDLSSLYSEILTTAI